MFLIWRFSYAWLPQYTQSARGQRLGLSCPAHPGRGTVPGPGDAICLISEWISVSPYSSKICFYKHLRLLFPMSSPSITLTRIPENMYDPNILKSLLRRSPVNPQVEVSSNARRTNRIRLRDILCLVSHDPNLTFLSLCPPYFVSREPRLRTSSAVFMLTNPTVASVSVPNHAWCPQKYPAKGYFQSSPTKTIQYLLSSLTVSHCHTGHLWA